MTLTYLIGRHNAFDSPWTSERDEVLKQLWAEGYSASEIACQFNGAAITRCAVIGRVRRLNLPFRKLNSTQRNKPYTIRRAAILKPIPASQSLQPQMRGLNLFELMSHHCRWPLELPGLFCAADTDGSDVYCSYHKLKARR